MCREQCIIRRPHLWHRPVRPAKRRRRSLLDCGFPRSTRDDKEDVQLVSAKAPTLMLEVAVDLGFEPGSSLCPAIHLDVGANRSVAEPDLSGAIRRQGGLPVFRVVGQRLILAVPEQPPTGGLRGSHQLDVEVVDGQGVVDVEEATSGSSRPKAQDLSVDSCELRRDARALGGQDVGPRAGTGERLRQVDYVPNQSKLLVWALTKFRQTRSRNFASSSAAKQTVASPP